MNTYETTNQPQVTPADQISADRRATFIMRTYNHVVGAILLFTGIEIYLFKSGYGETIARSMMGVSWLLVLGAFMLVGWLATRVAMASESKPMQYLALAGFVCAEAIIFVPLLYMAMIKAPGAINSAAWATLLGTAGLTAVALITKKDFSFLKGILTWGFMVAIVLIVISLLFGWHLGTWFSVGMIAFAGTAVLYDTSNILHKYPEDRYVGAALSLFASIALMFWYILQLLTSRD